MSKLNMSDVALPQETLEVDGVSYLVTAMPATKGLQFVETMQDGKADLSTMKQVICAYVCKDNKSITNDSFDVIFARKFEHLGALYKAVIVYNFGEDFLGNPDSEE